MRNRAGVERRWRGLLREQAKSGLSLKAFSRARGISPNTLAYWKYKRAARAAELAEVHVLGSEPLAARAADVIEIMLHGGRSLRVRGDIDAQRLRELMAAIESPC